MLSDCELSVSQVRLLSAVNDLEGKVWNPMIHWKKKHAVFVELRTQEGHIGVGECWCFDTAPDALIAYLNTEVLPHVLGRQVREIRAQLDELQRRATLTARHGILASAISGVDIALWDLHAQQQHLPVWRVLNPAGNGTVELYASGGLYGRDKNTDDLCEEFQRYIDDGFTGVKMKVGGLSIDEDAVRVIRVRETIGEKTKLFVDGVYSYTADTARTFYEKIVEHNISAFQSPVDAQQTHDMQMLCQSGIPVMGVEAEYRPEILKHLVENRAVSVLQVAPIACGGISAVMQLADRAGIAGITLSPEVSSTAVATMVACQLSAAHESIMPVEYHMIHQLFFEQLPFSTSDLRHGAVQLSDATGLGISLNTEQMQEHVRQSV